ncbi:MAG: exodeoxyribonuclease III [Candidatus Vogelbacteria bacterium]
MAQTFISWNVNGVRSVERKGFLDWLVRSNYDVVSLQETKVADHAILSEALRQPAGYRSYWHGAKEKLGYSGVAVFTKKEPKSARVDFGQTILSSEGRVLELDYGDFIFLTVYFPNGKASPARLEYKLTFYREFLQYIKNLRAEGRAIIFCGDVNTAHHEIDLARPRENEKISGFLPIERAWLDEVEQAGFVDSFRHFSHEAGQYTWWDQKSRARDRNVGWRIDYFFVSADLLPRLKRAFILADVLGSDHCPIGIELA